MAQPPPRYTRLAHDDGLYCSPSRRDGVSAATEALQRNVACEMIQEAGVLLALPQVVMVSAQTILHRFYSRGGSLREYSHLLVGAASLFIAAKVEETPKRLRELCTVYHRVFAKRVLAASGAGPAAPHLASVPLLDYYGRPGQTWKAEVVRVERFVLKEMGFALHFEHPHKFILVYVHTLRQKSGADDVLPENDQRREKTQTLARLWDHVSQTAWNYASDIMRTDLCTQRSPEILSCACIHRAIRLRGGQESDSINATGWWRVFSVDREQMTFVDAALDGLYATGSVIAVFEDLTDTSITEMAFLDESEDNYQTFAGGDSGDTDKRDRRGTESHPPGASEIHS